LVDALRENRCKFIAGKEGVHAELKLVEYILRKRKSIREKMPTLPLAVSKQCCDNCHKLIEAVNETIERRYEYRLVEVRGTHGGIFSARLPRFMESGSEVLSGDTKKEISDRFLAKIEWKSRDRKTLEGAFNRKREVKVSGGVQLHPKSRSPSPKIYGLPKDDELKEKINFNNIIKEEDQGATAITRSEGLVETVSSKIVEKEQSGSWRERVGKPSDKDKERLKEKDKEEDFRVESPSRGS
jgi:hypothetical protein